MLEGLPTLLATVAALLGLAFVFARVRRGAPRSRSALGPFLRHFESKGVPPEVAAAAFRQLERWMEAQDQRFAVRPDQSLSKVYGLIPHEVDAALERLAQECGRRRDPGRPPATLHTVSDLVDELARWPTA